MIISPEEGGEIVSRGGVIIYPTETLWGIGGDPFRKDVVKRIFDIKERPIEKHFILLVSSKEEVLGLVSDVVEEEKILMQKFWPGPLTIIFPTKNSLQKFLGETVAIRLSPHPAVKKILSRCRGPLISTSANISGKEPLKSLEEILMTFNNKVDAIVNGKSWGEQPSTIIDVRKRKILREGAISSRKLLSLLS